MRRFLNHLRSCLGKCPPRRRTRCPLAPFRPVLEQLEERRVLTVTFHGGPLLPHVDVETLFLGSGWNTDPTASPLTSQLSAYLQFMVGSNYLAMLHLAGYEVGLGTFVDSKIDAVNLPGSISDTQIQNDLTTLIQNGTLQPPDANRLYFVYVEPGVEVTTSFGNSINDFLGYHDNFNLSDNTPIYYAVIPYAGPPNATNGLGTFGQLTEVSSHELAESVTDPVPGAGWYDDTFNGEIGDIVNGQTVTFNAYSVQKIANKQDVGLNPNSVVGTDLVTLGTAVTPVRNQSFQGNVATFADLDGSGTLSSFTAQIAWGDGNTSTGQIVDNGDGTFSVTGSNTYLKNGSFTITVSISDKDGTSVQATSTAAVTGPASLLSAHGVSVAANEGQAFTGTVATFSDSDGTTTASSYTAQITWGDGNSSAGQIVANSNGTFSVTGTNTYASPGQYQVLVHISDTTDGDVAGTSSLATVQVVHVPDMTAQGQDFTATAGQSFRGIVATFVDPDDSGNPTSYAAQITWGDGQSSTGIVQLNSNGGFSVLAFHTYARAGMDSVHVTITDNDGDSAGADASATVKALHIADLSGQGQNVTATAGQAFTGIVATFVDPDGSGTLTNYTAQITWGDGQTSTGQITADGNNGYSVTGTNTYAQAGNYSITVQLTDSDTDHAVTHSTAAVQAVHVPDLTAQGQNITATAGQAVSAVVATFTDPDTPDSPEDYTAQITWGDGHSATGQIVPLGNGAYNVLSTNTYAQGGNYAIQVTITDSDTDVANANGTAAVKGVHVPDLTAQGQNFTATVGQQFSGSVASFTDGDSSGAITDYRITITWGDGVTSVGQVVDNGNGSFSVVAFHTYARAGSYGARVLIFDSDGDSAGVSDSATVQAPHIPDLHAQGQGITATAGQSFTGPVATFTDGDGTTTTTDYTAQITWGDGHTSVGQIVAGSGGIFTVVGTNTYAQSGPYTVQVALLDTDGDTANLQDSASVQPPHVDDLSAQEQAVSVTAGQLFNGTVATFTDPDNSGTLADYTAQITWGDGHTSAGQIVAGTGGTFKVLGSNTYANAGQDTITVTITDADSDSATVMDSATVQAGHINDLSAQGQNLMATAGQVFSGTVATFTDPDGSGSLADYTAQITWDDGHTSAGQIVANNDSSFSVTGSNTYAAAGVYSVQVAITDSDGETATSTATASVQAANIPDLSGAGQAVTTGTGATFSGTVATFTDPDSGESQGTFTAQITWGDGHNSTGQIVANGAGSFSVTGANTYAAAGSFTIQVAISDSDGDSTTVSSTATVTAPDPYTVRLITVANDLTHSAEYYTNLIEADYQKYLGRAADSGGLAFWLNNLENGLSDEHLEASFFSSPEFIKNNGGLGSSWVQAVYQDELGRAADPGGLNFFLGEINQGINPAVLTFQFAASPEREAQRIAADYTTFLGRPLDAGGQTYWVDQFENHGASNEDVVAGFVGSLEYYQKHGATYTSWLSSAFQAILNRQPTTAEMSQYLSFLNTGQ